MVTLIRVNTPALPVQGIPPTLSIQILRFAVLSPRVREWPLHLSSYPRQKPDSLRCLNIGRFISLISALTLASLACWWRWGRCKFLLSTLSFFFFPYCLLPPAPSSLCSCACMFILSSVLLVIRRSQLCGQHPCLYWGSAQYSGTLIPLGAFGHSHSPNHDDDEVDGDDN